jgi:hypothetical protein
MEIKMLESKLKTNFKKKFKERFKKNIDYHSVISLHPGKNGVARGTPDIVVFTNKGAIFCEWKRPGGVISEAQKIQYLKLKKIGYKVEFFYSVDDAIKYFEELLND